MLVTHKHAIRLADHTSDTVPRHDHTCHQRRSRHDDALRAQPAATRALDRAVGSALPRRMRAFAALRARLPILFAC